MANIDNSKWVSYAERNPEKEGPYLWRVPSKTLKGETVVVAAWMRKRGAGYEEVLSPLFDYWDGYRVHVPEGLQWQETDEFPNLKWHESEFVCIEGLKFCNCIYCGNAPKLQANQRTYDGGLVVRAAPQNLNTFWLSCCSWGNTPFYSDPRKLEEIRRKAIETAWAMKGGM